MSVLKGIGVVCLVISVIIATIVHKSQLKDDPPLQEYRLDHYWGKKLWKLGDTLPKDNPAVVPFKIKIDQSVLDDLKNRLKRVRLQESFEKTNFEYGIRSDVLKVFIDYWLNSYDWKKHEDHLNSFPQFKTEVEGLDIHFLHIKSKNSGAIPLILVHGWPGSFLELLKVIPKLTDKFELVIPSLPGFGFSNASSKPGLHTFHIARIFAKLMERLGHKKFMYHGGDWGSTIGYCLSRTFPERVIGYHTTLPSGQMTLVSITKIFLSQFGFSSLVFENQWEADRWVPIEKVFSLLIKELGDMHLKATKPDTIGVALNNDPAGLAAYILDTFAFASRADYASQPDGRLYEIFTKDELLTNIMIYWVNNCFTSSARIYKESLPAVFSDFGLVTVPTAALIAKNEIMPLTPTLMKECYSDVVKYTALDKAGHFLALEEPDVVAKDIIEFAEMLRARRAEQPE